MAGSQASFSPLSNQIDYGGWIKAIVPNPWKVDKIREFMLNWLRAKGAQANVEYNKTVRSWKQKPTFAVQSVGLTRSTGNLTVTTGITTTGVRAAGKGGIPPWQIYYWVDYGTNPHLIGDPGESSWVFTESIIDGKPARVGERTTTQTPGAKPLRFMGRPDIWHNKPGGKTLPGVLDSSGGVGTDGQLYSKWSVTQGIAPRGFSLLIASRMSEIVSAEAPLAMIKALEHAGLIAPS